jgi:dTDP-glucose 4,6-dehydratase
MNVFGERQHPEKMIPKTVHKVLTNEPMTIHADKTKTISGSRFYIHADSVADALLYILKNIDTYGDKFNIVGDKEVSNLDLAKQIASVIGKPLNYEMVDFHSSRPGHDLRYALDGEKMKDLGWKHPRTFDQSLEDTVNWIAKNKKWLEAA